MNQPANFQAPNLPISQPTNPYVGPRTFTEREGRFFFGREREARDLTARIVSERLLLFYAQSGAGKSSLLHARVIPRLRDEERFQVLPVGRVSGEPPAGAAVDNIFAFNLMTSLDQSGESPVRLAHVTLSDFLARLTRETVTDTEGRRSWRWVYKPVLMVERPAAGVAPAATGPRFVLVIDQFEELITSHPGRWREREDFFRQLNQALLDDPNLWAVPTLREDYVAALDPCAELVFNRLRARFYMERMGVAAALDAIRKPAELAGRPFAAGVAERLRDDLCQIRVAGQEGTVPGQYVEPVQLQVVCYQLWEQLKVSGSRLQVGDDDSNLQPATFEPVTHSITEADLREAGNVDQSLAAFYESAVASVVAQPTLGVNEQQLRTWFSTKLITETGTRGTVFRNEQRRETAGLPNAAVDALARQFLLRTELRAGGSWVELVHDRFVEPIVRANRARQTPLALDAEAWQAAGRAPTLCYEGQKLQDALRRIAAHPEEHNEIEREFLRAGQQGEERRKALRRKRMQVIFGTLGALIAVLAVAALVFAAAARSNSEFAQVQRLAAERAAAAALTAEAAALAQKEMAEAASTEVVVALSTAQAANAAQVRAMVELEAALQVNLTALALAAATPMPAATPSPTRPAFTPTLPAPGATPRPTATALRTSTPAPSPTANPLVVAQQTQLAQVRATQTVLATVCRLPAGATFARAWDRAGLGCPTAGEAAVTTAYEAFERGWMLWRKDNDQIYAFFDGGTYRTFTLPSEARPEFACAEAASLGNPRLGFSRVWCEDADVRGRLGNPLAGEIGGDRPLQAFEKGFMIYTTERGGVIGVYAAGQWSGPR